MDDDHGELEVGSKSGRKLSPLSELILFTLVFGWEGPLAIYLCFAREEYGGLIAAVLLTAFFWGLFGIDLIKDVVRGSR